MPRARKPVPSRLKKTGITLGTAHLAEHDRNGAGDQRPHSAPVVIGKRLLGQALTFKPISIGPDSFVAAGVASGG